MKKYEEAENDKKKEERKRRRRRERKRWSREWMKKVEPNKLMIENKVTVDTIVFM